MKRTDWREHHYFDALFALRESKLFSGFAVSDGYAVRRRSLNQAIRAAAKDYPDAPLDVLVKRATLPKYAYTGKLRPAQKRQIRLHERMLRSIRENAVVIIKPSSKTMARKMRRLAGWHSSKLVGVPIVIPPNMGKVRAKVLAVDTVQLTYPDRNLVQTIKLFDFKSVIKTIDFSVEETNTKDEVAEAVGAIARDFIDSLPGDSYFFRLRSHAGDINPDRYLPTMFGSDIVEEQLPRIIGRYFDVSRPDDLLVNGMSAWRRIQEPRRLWDGATIRPAAHNYAPKPRRRRSKRERATGRK